MAEFKLICFPSDKEAPKYFLSFSSSSFVNGCRFLDGVSARGGGDILSVVFGEGVLILSAVFGKAVFISSVVFGEAVFVVDVFNLRDSIIVNALAASSFPVMVW